MRKYAVSAVYTIHKAFPDLIPDAPQLVERFLDLEFNLAAKRNAFYALFQVAQVSAAFCVSLFAFLLSCFPLRFATDCVAVVVVVVVVVGSRRELPERHH